MELEQPLHEEGSIRDGKAFYFLRDRHLLYDASSYCCFSMLPPMMPLVVLSSFSRLANL